MEPGPTDYKEPASPTWMPEQFDFQPTDDLTDAQKEKERQKDEERRAAFAEKKKSAKTAVKRLATKQSVKKPSQKVSTDRTDPARREECQEKMRRGFKEWYKTRPQVQVISIRSAEEIRKQGSGTKNRAPHRPH